MILLKDHDNGKLVKGTAHSSYEHVLPNSIFIAVNDYKKQH